MFGDFGKLTVDELWDLLSDLVMKEGAFHTAYNDGDTSRLWKQELHHYQYKMWFCQQQQLMTIVQCAKEISETSFYGAPWEMAKKALEAARERNLQAATQEITRHGVKFDGKWYTSENLLAHQGERVFVKCPNKHIVEIWSIAGEIIESIPVSRGQA